MVDSCLLLLLICSVLGLVSGSSKELPIISFDEGYSPLFGDANLAILKDGKTVHMSLDERTGHVCFVVFSGYGFLILWRLVLCWILGFLTVVLGFGAHRFRFHLSGPLPPWILQRFDQVACRLYSRSCRRVLCE